MVTEQQHRNLFTAAIPFVMERRKEGGGFGATPETAGHHPGHLSRPEYPQPFPTIRPDRTETNPPS